MPLVTVPLLRGGGFDFVGLVSLARLGYMILCKKIIRPGWLNPLLVFYFSRFPKQIQVTSVHSWPSISLRDVLRSAELNKKPQPQPPLSYWRVRRMPNYTIYITWWHIIHCWVYGFAVNPTTPTSHRAVSDSLLSGWSERWWPAWYIVRYNEIICETDMYLFMWSHVTGSGRSGKVSYTKRNTGKKIEKALMHIDARNS